MKLSPKEENFLKHWIYDECHFMDKTLLFLSKKLLRPFPVIAGEIAELIVAWMPDPEEQFRASEGPPPETPPEWPWASRQEFDVLLGRAREELEARNAARRPLTTHR